MALFAASKLQVATYLLGVCPFSIAFLVFLNSSVSFVITDLIGQETKVGDAVGTLGFADELVAILACPLWGLLSDRIGVRYVCVAGYLIIALALALFVQARNVYPQLLLGRLFFSLGGAAASTMVTAVLPSMSERPTGSQDVDGHTHESDLPSSEHSRVPALSIASELTITPARLSSINSPPDPKSSDLPDGTSSYASTSRVAGFVGMFTGCGALIALLLFLPLPAKFQHAGRSPDLSLKYSFYIVAAVAFVLALWCFIGLRNIQYEDTAKLNNTATPTAPKLSTVWRSLLTALKAGFSRSDIALGYIGGFVARASSVGISLFIPLMINALFLASDLCKTESAADSPQGLPDIKRKCPRAYVLAAELTGMSQMVALICAPIFGYASSRTSRRGLPLMVASAAGIIGYPLFATQFDVDDQAKAKRLATFLAVGLIGISQIGAIVCSLGVLSSGIIADPDAGRLDGGRHVRPGDEGDEEEDTLLGDSRKAKESEQSLSAIKGSVAGIYSFYGGAAILILTKVGGSLFDKVSVGAPFYIMASFNGVLMVACIFLGLHQRDAEAR